MKFYRWIDSPNAVEYKKSFHGPTTVFVSPEDAKEILANSRPSNGIYDYAPDAVIISLDEFDAIKNSDEFDRVELDVIPELEGVCCFDDIEDVLGYRGSFMMIFEGEEVGSVWDGKLARVDNVLEVVPVEEFLTRI